MNSAKNRAFRPWHEDLSRIGFVCDSSPALWRQNGTSFETDGRWSVLRAGQPSLETDPLRTQLGKPGLWKWVFGAPDGGVHRVFDLPPSVAREEEDDPLDEDEAGSPLVRCVAWAMQTLDGNVPEGWQSPPLEEVQSWIPRGGLTVQFGRVLRQGSLLHDQRRLAIRFPVVPVVPESLPGARRAWLREILVEAQTRARMARLGWTDSGGVAAEVDFSGAPRAALERLFVSGLTSVRWLVEWLEPADFIVDASLACRAFEVCPVRAEPAERRNQHDSSQ